MNEIAERLRSWRLVHLTQLRYLMETASDEIERLQALADKRGELAVDRRREIERLRQVAEQKNMTDAEREAVEQAIKSLLDDPYDGAPISPHAATLRGLLERMGGER